MKKRAKKAKALKRARPATRGPARSEVSGIAKPAAELFVKSVLARGEAAKVVKGKLPPGVTHEIIGKGADGLLILKRRRFRIRSPSAPFPMISWVTPGGSLPLTTFAASPRASTLLTKSSAAGFAIPLTSDRAGPRVAGRARLRALAFFARFFMAVCYTGWFPTATGSFTTPGRSRSRTSAERARSPRPGARAHGSCGRTGGRRASRLARARRGRHARA